MNDKIIGFWCGFIGGFTKYVWLQIKVPSFGENLTKAGITALICGLMGVAGKDIYGMVKRTIKSYRQKKLKP